MSEIIEFIKNCPATPMRRKKIKSVIRISAAQQVLLELMAVNGPVTSDASCDASFRGLLRIKYVEIVGDVDPAKWTTYRMTQKAVKYLSEKAAAEAKDIEKQNAKIVDTEVIQPLWNKKPIMNGRYSVDEGGNVYNSSGKRLRPGRQSRGYLVVSLYDGSSPKKCKSYLVHRLVAEAFLGPSSLPQVNHIDGDKENNRLSNLEFCSAVYNREHYLSELKWQSTPEQPISGCTQKTVNQV